MAQKNKNLNNMMISKFNGINPIVLGDISVTDVHDLILNSSELQICTNRLRVLLNENDTATYKEEKKGLSGVTFAGKFSSRSNDNLVTYENLICIDIDDITTDQILDIRNLQSKDNSVLLMFISPSAKGIKIIHRINSVKQPIQDYKHFHLSAFKYFESYYMDKLNIEIDKNCKDVSRLTFLASDKTAYLNNSATAVNIELCEDTQQYIPADYYGESEKFELTQGLATTIIQDILTYLIDNKLSITEDYIDWRNVGFALKETFDDAQARKFFIEFSKLDKNFLKKDAKNKFKQLNVTTTGRKVSFATIIYLATQAGWVLPDARETRRFRLSAGQRNILRIQNKKDILIQNKIKLRINLLTFDLDKFDWNTNTWEFHTEDELNYCYIHLFMNTMAKSVCKDFLRSISPRVNPVNEFIKDFPDLTGDSTDYIRLLADTLHSSNPDITYILLKKWLIGMHDTLNTSNNINENILILLGEQFLGKTNWIRRLLPNKYKKYLLEASVIPSNADEVRRFGQNFICFDDEMSNILNNNKSLEHFKSISSARSKQIRKAYDMLDTNFIMRISFVGTSNISEYIRDTTGTRRFFNIECLTDIDFKYKFDIMKVHSQAYSLFKKGEQSWLSKEEYKMLIDYNKQFEVLTPEEHYLTKYIQAGDKYKLNATEIIMAINNMEDYKYDLINPNKNVFIGKLLHKMGFNNSKNNKHLYSLSFKDDNKYKTWRQEKRLMDGLRQN